MRKKRRKAECHRKSVAPLGMIERAFCCNGPRRRSRKRCR